MSDPPKTKSGTILSECPRCKYLGRSEDCKVCLRDPETNKTTGQCGLGHAVQWILENPEYE